MNLIRIVPKIFFAGFILSAFVGFSQGNSISPSITVDEILLNNISSPWGMDFIDDDQLIYTEKSGKLKKFTISTKSTVEITGLPSIAQKGQGGLLDVALHPNFSTNKFIYLSYAVAATGGQTTAIGRAVLNNNQLTNFTELFRGLPVVDSDVHFGSRIAFDKDNFLYFSMGDRGTSSNAQNTNNHAGKIMRLNDDGTIPADNPLVGVANAKAEIYSWGHRNIQGLALNPANGKIYAHEHGPKGGDELNLIKKGTNYGWPTVTFGINYNGTIISSDTTLPGLELPLTYWVPSIAPSGLVFVQNGQATDEADVLIGALVGTHLQWVKMKDDKKILATKSLQGYARFRDVAQSPNGKLYALTETPNRLLSLNSNILTGTIDKLKEEITDLVYPNPSSESATLQIFLSKKEKVTVRILSIEGASFISAFNGYLDAGTHAIQLTTNELPKGMYQIEISKKETKSYLKLVKN